MLTIKKLSKIPGYEFIDVDLYHRITGLHNKDYYSTKYIFEPAAKIAIRQDFNGPSRVPRKAVPLQLYVKNEYGDFDEFERIVYLIV